MAGDERSAVPPYGVRCPQCGAEPVRRCETKTRQYAPPHGLRWKAVGVPAPNQDQRLAALRFYDAEIRPMVLKRK